MSILEHLPEESRATIVRLRSLGDCVLTTPAISLLKKARPDLRISVAVEQRFRPVFENNPDAYHGYDINNYLRIDPHFGSKQDLVDLVDAAHSFQKNGKPFPIRIILDVVINHSGDNWFYQGGSRFFYFNDQIFPFGDFRRTDRPIPIEFRNQEWYHRRGEMRDFDHPPENQHGDIVGLKDYANDDDAIGSELINALIKVHAYWIREADVDGFRVDAVKHMGELASSRFCSNIREYAYSLGKRGFFLFGESLLIIGVRNTHFRNRRCVKALAAAVKAELCLGL